MNYNSTFLIIALAILVFLDSFGMEKEDDGNGNNHDDSYSISCGSEKAALLPKTNHMADSSTTTIASPVISITTIPNDNGETLNGNNIIAITKKADLLDNLRQQNMPRKRRWIGNFILIGTLLSLNIAAGFATYYITNNYSQAVTNDFIKNICCPYYNNQTLCSNVTWDKSQCFLLSFSSSCNGWGYENK